MEKGGRISDKNPRLSEDRVARRQQIRRVRGLKQEKMSVPKTMGRSRLHSWLPPDDLMDLLLRSTAPKGFSTRSPRPSNMTVCPPMDALAPRHNHKARPRRKMGKSKPNSLALAFEMQLVLGTPYQKDQRLRHQAGACTRIEGSLCRK